MSADSTGPALHFQDAGGFVASVEGMRALAVLAVLLFHLDVAVAGGGYLGVDLFFVISGFVITRNIQSDLQSGSFTFRAFYTRRFRRLFPALLVTILATLVAGYFILPPPELEKTAASAMYSLLSLANFHFWLQADYFDAIASTKPFLHTWSLSVEEQFYLLWPAVLLVMASRKWRLVGVLLFFILSMAGVLVLYNRAPESVFYLLPFRLHHLMAGALLALSMARLRGMAGEIAAVLSLCAIMLLFGLWGGNVHPALAACLTSIAGFLMLIACEARLAQVILANRVMVWVGQRSYAIYLVHWPLIVLFMFQTDFWLRKRDMALLFVATMVLALLLHELVEKPFRKRGKDTTLAHRLAVPGSLGGLAAALVLAFTMVWQDGFADRTDYLVRSVLESVSMEQRLRRQDLRVGQCHLVNDSDISEYDIEACGTVRQGKKNILVIGDSMGADIYVMLARTYPEMNVMQATANACTPVVDNRGIGENYPACMALNKLRFNTLLEQDIDLVVIAGIWTEDRVAALVDTVEHIQRYRKRVLVFGPRATYRGGVPRLISREKNLEDINDKLALTVDRHLKVLQGIRAALGEDVPLIDMYSLQCEPECTALENQRLLYVDAIHLTRLGSERLGERFRKIFQLERFLATPRST